LPHTVSAATPSLGTETPCRDQRGARRHQYAARGGGPKPRRRAMLISPEVRRWLEACDTAQASCLCRQPDGAPSRTTILGGPARQSITHRRWAAGRSRNVAGAVGSHRAVARHDFQPGSRSLPSLCSYADSRNVLSRKAHTHLFGLPFPHTWSHSDGYQTLDGLGISKNFGIFPPAPPFQRRWRLTPAS